MSLLLLLAGGGTAVAQRVASPGCYHLEQHLVTTYSAAQQRQDNYQAAATWATLYTVSFGTAARYEALASLATHYLAEAEVC